MYAPEKSLEFFIKNQLTKSNPKKTGGGKCPLSCQLGLSTKKVAIYVPIHLLMCALLVCTRMVGQKYSKFGKQLGFFSFSNDT